MITLLSLRLRNFRKVKEGVFTPLETGVTGLSGENGAGKSSFLYGALWALYGVRPDDVPTSGLRRQESSVKDECSVSVLFAHSGQTIEVIRELRGKSNRVVLNIFVDGKEQTVTSVGEGEKWIANRLKIDAAAFTTAFVIQQKELDSLVDARPAERRSIIERLSGIEKMSEALKNARSEENDAKKAAALMGGDEDSVDQAGAIYEEKEAEVDSLEQELESAYKDVSLLSAELETANAELAELVAARKSYVETEEKVKESQARISSISREIARNEEEKKELNPHSIDKSSAELEAEGKALSNEKKEASDALSQAQKELQSQQSKQEVLAHNIARTEEELKEAEERVAAIESSISAQDREKLDQEFQDAEKEVSTFVDTLGQIASQVAVAQKQKDTSTRSLSLLKDSHSHSSAECPTCHSRLEDASSLIEEMESTLTEIDSELDALAKKKEESQDSLRKAEEQRSALRSKIEESDKQESALQGAQEAVAAAQGRLEQYKGEQGRLPSDKPVKRKIADLEADMESLDAQLEAVREAYTNAKHAERTAARVNKLDEDLSNLRTLYDEAVSTAEEAESFLATLLEVSEEEVKEHERFVQEESSKVDQAKEKAQSIKYNLGIEKERMGAAKTALKAAESELERKQAALALASQKAAVSDLLDEFRKNRVATIAPELSETATSLISSMTNGYYTEVLLDENFTPSVIDSDGNEKPVSWLSGGEESVVALALRIAIGDLMTGGEGGLLWLDEVLTAQDSNRRSSLLNTLRNISGRQIVMINHTHGATDMVDRIITITDTGDGSTILEDAVESETV